MIDGERESVQIDRLSDDQRQLLQTYLRGAQIPFELTATSVSVDPGHVDDLYSALEIVGNALGGRQPDASADVDGDVDGDGDEIDLAAEFDSDGEPQSLTARLPIIVERPVAVQGRTVASPTRRFVGALIDWVILTAGVVGADRAGAPNWAIVVAFGLYVVVATSVWGRTIGKLVVGTKVIATATGRPPGLARSFIRWFVVSWGSVLELLFGTWPIGVATAIFAILVVTYAPILWDLRCQGWHDRAADTVVVRAGL